MVSKKHENIIHGYNNVQLVTHVTYRARNLMILLEVYYIYNCTCSRGVHCHGEVSTQVLCNMDNKNGQLMKASPGQGQLI